MTRLKLWPKVLSKIVVADILDFFFHFSKKKDFVRQTINMKRQALLSLKNLKKKSKYHKLQL